MRHARRLKLSPEVVVPKGFRCSHLGGDPQSVVASLFVLLTVSSVDARQEVVDDKVGH